MKFGKTVVSDPRRSERLLSLLDSIQAKDLTASGGGDGAEGGVGLGDFPIPKSKEDREAFVQV